MQPSPSVEEDVQVILRITDPGACWRNGTDGSVQLRVSVPVDGGSFRHFHRRLVQHHGVERYALHWEPGASVAPHTGEPFDGTRGDHFPPFFRLIVRRDGEVPLDDGAWMRWIAAPASAEVSVLFQASRGDAPSVGIVDWSKCPHPVRAPHLGLHLAGVDDPGLCKFIRALQRSGSNVRSVYVKLSRIPQVRERILEALRMRTLGPSVRPCRLWLCVPDLTEADRAAIGAIAALHFVAFRWVDGGGAVPRVLAGQPCTAPVEHLPVDVANTIGALADGAAGAALALASKRMRASTLPHPLISVRMSVSDLPHCEDPERVKHLRVLPPPVGGNPAVNGSTHLLGGRFPNLRSLWVSGVVRIVPASVSTSTGADPIHRLRRLHWDNALISPEAAAQFIAAHPADRVSLCLTLRIDGDVARACEALFVAIESLTCEWLSLALIVAASSDRANWYWMDWSRVRPLHWPATMRRLELRAVYGDARIPRGNYAPFVGRAAPNIDYLRIDLSFRSVSDTQNPIDAGEPMRRAVFCIGLIGPDDEPDRDVQIEEMSALLRVGAAERSHVIVDLTSHEGNVDDALASTANDVCWDAQSYAPSFRRVDLDVLLNNSSYARTLSQVMSDSHHEHLPNLNTVIRYLPTVPERNNGEVVPPGGMFPIAPMPDWLDDWAFEGPIPESAYRPLGR